MSSIYFRTLEFPTEPEGDLEFCNGQPGSVLARWLRSELQQAGIAGGEPLQEDYGWGFWLEGPLSVWVAVSFAGDEPGSADRVPEWCVSVMHEVPLFALSQWFRRREGRELAGHVFEVLKEAVSGREGMMIIAEDDD